MRMVGGRKTWIRGRLQVKNAKLRGKRGRSRVANGASVGLSVSDASQSNTSDEAWRVVGRLLAGGISTGSPPVRKNPPAVTFPSPSLRCRCEYSGTRKRTRKNTPTLTPLRLLFLSLSLSLSLPSVAAIIKTKIPTSGPRITNLFIHDTNLSTCHFSSRARSEKVPERVRASIPRLLLSFSRSRITFFLHATTSRLSSARASPIPRGLLPVKRLHRHLTARITIPSL